MLQQRTPPENAYDTQSGLQSRRGKAANQHSVTSHTHARTRTHTHTHTKPDTHTHKPSVIIACAATPSDQRSSNPANSTANLFPKAGSPIPA